MKSAKTKQKHESVKAKAKRSIQNSIVIVIVLLMVAIALMVVLSPLYSSQVSSLLGGNAPTGIDQNDTTQTLINISYIKG